MEGLRFTVMCHRTKLISYSIHSDRVPCNGGAEEVETVESPKEGDQDEIPWALSISLMDNDTAM